MPLSSRSPQAIAPEPAPQPLPEVEPRVRLRFLDALRGVASASVMVFHLYGAAAIGDVWPASGAVHQALLFGASGVEAFFVLSGFVICRNVEAVRRLDAATLPAFLARFTLRRSIRLDPPYWAVIALNLLFLATLSATDRAATLGVGPIVQNMLYVNGLLGTEFIVPVGWTLCFELQFYLAFALLAGAVRVLSSTAGLPIGVARIAVFLPPLIASLAFSHRVSPMFDSPWALGGWHLFFLGAALAWWTEPAATDRRASLGLLAAAFAASAFVLADTRWIDVLGGIACGLGLLAAHATGTLARFGEGPRGAWLARGLLFLGTISYSLYLVHPLVGNKGVRFLAARLADLPDDTTRTLAQWALVAGGTLASIGCAWVLHEVAELPAQRLARRVPLEP